MASVATIFHSGFGHTKRVAEHIANGVGESGVESALFSVDDLGDPDAPAWDVLDRADAIVFGAPTYMGDCSAGMRQFLEATSSRWASFAWKDKLAAGFTNSGSQNGDKQNTLVSLATFAAQHGMVWISLGIAPGNNHSAGSVDDLNRLGASLGLKAQSNVDEPPEVAPTKADLETAYQFGLRIAACANRWSERQG